MKQRSAYDIKKGLLKRAFAQGRGAEMIQRILDCKRRLQALCRPEDKVKMAFFDATNISKERSLRALNLLERMNGSGRQYSRTDDYNDTLNIGLN